MDQLLEILKRHPWLLFVAVAWIAGAVGKVAQGQKKAAERAARRQPPEVPSAAGSAPPPLRRAAPKARPAAPASREPDEIAAEMRRILGLDVDTGAVQPRTSPPIVRAPVRRPVEPERAPTAVVPTTGQRHLALHEAPHVGEAVMKRRGPRSGKIGQHDRDWGS
ncbi:MAG: hypothetical protein KDC98_17845, partial [Planctomycetes bacterium]|nr:hypothetical protein [Planctomycetota bacterium]